LNKLQVNTNQINKDLDDNYVVITEGIQTLLRHRGIPNPYEAMKTITRTNNDCSSKDEIKTKINEYLETIEISEEDKQKIKNLTPNNYCGRKLK
jgi:adenylosuccinate lyase